VRVEILRNPRSIRAEGSLPVTAPFGAEAAKRVRRFHRGLPGFGPAPLLRLGFLERGLGVGRVWLKDESVRFGLKAFKVLGASWAVSNVLARRMGMNLEAAGFEGLRAVVGGGGAGGFTLATATDGNHGRAVAWMARLLGLSAAVFVPRGSSPARLEAIRREGAGVTVVEGNYDRAVRTAEEQSVRNGWILVQDSSWEGYEEIPTWIMQGYLTVLDEAWEALAGEVPTHLFLQCGVGSLAGALAAHVHERFGKGRPLVVVVEPERAACMKRSVAEFDGEPKAVDGALETIMAGLACGEPSLLAWRILRDLGDAFASCSDEVSKAGMRLLAEPAEGWPGVVSGESGAVTAGLLAALARGEGFLKEARALELDPGSRILLLSTEGDTDPLSYRSVVEGGKS